MTNKPITPEEMKAYVDATWEKCQAEAWQEPVAWMYVNTDGECEQIEYSKNEPMPDDPSVTPLYTAPRQWQRLTEEEIARREIVKPILVRIMQEAYDLADRDDSEGYNSVKVMCSDVLAMINKLLDKHQWQGLTDEEIKEIIGPWGETPITGYTRKLFDQIEAKLKEKNR